MTADDLDRLALDAAGNPSAEANFGRLLHILWVTGALHLAVPREVRPTRTNSDARTDDPSSSA